MHRFRQILTLTALLAPALFIFGKLLLTPIHRAPNGVEAKVVFWTWYVEAAGWPWEFRSFSTASGHFLPFTFSWLALLADCTVFVLATCVLAILLLWHRHRRGAWWRIALRELLLVITLLASVFGWLWQVRHEWQLEQGDDDRFAGDINLTIHGDICAPGWAMRLFPSSILQYFERVTTLWVSEDAPNNLFESKAVQRRFSHLTKLTILNGLSIEKLDPALLCRIETLELEKCGENAYLAAEFMTNLQELKLVNCVCADDFLKALPAQASLRSLQVANCDHLTDAGLRILTNAPMLSHLTIYPRPNVDEATLEFLKQRIVDVQIAK
jgi:hypothetical protein